MNKKVEISAIEIYVIDFIRNLRATKGLSQEGIGNILGLSRSYIRDIENPNSRAKYTLSHIEQLAEHFRISPREFLPEKY